MLNTFVETVTPVTKHCESVNFHSEFIVIYFILKTELDPSPLIDFRIFFFLDRLKYFGSKIWNSKIGISAENLWKGSLQLKAF